MEPECNERVHSFTRQKTKEEHFEIEKKKGGKKQKKAGFSIMEF